jgi:hypothetical protein
MNKKIINEPPDNNIKISRKEFLGRSGKVITLGALATFTILGATKVNALDPPIDPCALAARNCNTLIPNDPDPNPDYCYLNYVSCMETGKGCYVWKYVPEP